MTLIEILRKRRSIRKFTDRPVEKEVVVLFEEALLRSPSSRGIQPWNFILVTESTMIRQLASAKQHGSEFLAGAALAVVITGDETRSDVWTEDCSIAAIIIQLLAVDLGLGSCWAQIRNRPHDAQTSAESFVQSLLDIPRHERVAMIIGLGYPEENPPPVPAEKLDRSKIRHIPAPAGTQNPWREGEAIEGSRRESYSDAR